MFEKRIGLARPPIRRGATGDRLNVTIVLGGMGAVSSLAATFETQTKLVSYDPVRGDQRQKSQSAPPQTQPDRKERDAQAIYHFSHPPQQ